VHRAAAGSLDAIVNGRSLLDDPDPLTPIIGDVCDALRAAVTTRWDAYSKARASAIERLAGSEDWRSTDEPTRLDILRNVGMGDARAPAVGSIEELLEALDAVPLADWQFRIQAVPEQAGQALAKATAGREPETIEVSAPKAVIRAEKDLDAYLAAVRTVVKGHLDDGKTVIL